MVKRSEVVWMGFVGLGFESEGQWANGPWWYGWVSRVCGVRERRRGLGLGWWWWVMVKGKGYGMGKGAGMGEGGVWRWVG